MAKRWKGLIVLVAMGMLITAGAHASVSGSAKKIRSLGVKWLVRHQNDDGSYGKDDEMRVGKTALVVWALATCQRGYQVVDGPYMSEAVAYLLKQQQEDGRFGTATGDVGQFNTALTAMALKSLYNAKEYEAARNKASGWILKNMDPKYRNQKIEVLGGLPSISWPAESPQPLHALQKETKVKLMRGKKGDWVEQTLETVAALQDRADDTAESYGRIQSKAKDGPEADPVVATALGITIADRIKDQYKKLK